MLVRSAWRAATVASVLLLAATAAAREETGSTEVDASRTEWPRWRGADFNDSSRATGVFSGSFTLERRWTARLGSGYSGIVVAGGNAVTLFSDGTDDVLVALDADTGRERWRTTIAPTYPGREGANDGPVSTPAIADGRVFALGPRGDLLAADLLSGRVLWRRRLVEELGAAMPHWGFGTSPLVTRGLVVVLTGGAQGEAISAFDAASGATVWRAGADEAGYQSPLLIWIDGEERLIVGGDRALHAIDPMTGKELWTREHGGEGFYRQILNPVLVGDDALLLTSRPDEAELLRVAGQRETVWITRQLGRNYATPVYHDGRIYGYKGGFLSCVDARSGQRIWRSRPPGDGFAILVDGHLVILTKNGSLHVVEATPDGYHERERIDLFSLLTWTPPSFARGRIYARDSYGEIAAVDVVPVDSPARRTEPPVSVAAGTLPGSGFAHWVAEVERSTDPEARVRRFLARQVTFPVLENDRRVHFLYQGEVRDIALRGSMLEAGRELPLHRVGATDLYYASFELEPEARVHYQFVRNLEEFIADPRNPVQSEALNFPGQVSVLFMPQAQRGPEPRPSSAPKGRLVELPFSTERVAVGGKTWGGEREVRVYLPAGYDDEGSRRYPTLYVLYGNQMIHTAHVDSVLDRLIGNGIDPFIAVFVQSISPYEYARSQRELHGRMIVEKLIPTIDERFRTRPEGHRRALLGVDEAGYAVVELGLHHPELFGAVVAMSPFPVGEGASRMLERIEPAGADAPAFYVDWGRYDARDDRRRIDVPRFSARLRERLVERGYSVRGHEWKDGSDLVLWGLRSEDALREMLP